MTTERLACECRAEIERRLAVCEAATGMVMLPEFPDVIYVGGHPSLVGERAAAFIAASRNERPAELRALLGAVDCLASDFNRDRHAGEQRVRLLEIARTMGILEDK